MPANNVQNIDGKKREWLYLIDNKRYSLKFPRNRNPFEFTYLKHRKQSVLSIVDFYVNLRAIKTHTFKIRLVGSSIKNKICIKKSKVATEKKPIEF